MRSGIKVSDIVKGEGDEAVRVKVVIVNVRTFLNHGTELTGPLYGGLRTLIDPKRRNHIAGLRYGIEGMRVGGRREIIISPHLAYGSAGLPGHVPANAVIRCEVELLEVLENAVPRPEDYPPGKYLYVFHPGEAARNQPRWQFGLREDGHGGVFIVRPILGIGWRHAPYENVESKFDVETTQAFFRHALDMNVLFPKDCLLHEQLWVDASEPCNSITREKASNSLCLTIGVQVRGQWLSYFSIAETSQAILESPLLKRINAMLHLE